MRDMTVSYTHLNVERILPRKNELIRPAVSNIDMALVIFASAKPDPNFNLLDRFLCMMAVSYTHLDVYKRQCVMCQVV